MVRPRDGSFFGNLTVAAVAAKPMFYVNCEYATTLRTYVHYGENGENGANGQK